MKNLVAMNKLFFILGVLVLGGGLALASDNPNTPSQLVQCALVDNALAQIPHGDGGGGVTSTEVGPGGWRYSNGGGSFVTFAHALNDNGTAGDPSDDFYDVDAGRSRTAGNALIINDYPSVLDLPQTDLDGAIVFSRRRGEIILTGDSLNDPPLFKLPGSGGGMDDLFCRIPLPGHLLPPS